MTKASFQPVNQLSQDEDKKIYSNEHTSQENKNDIPEIITAQPEDAFITVLVTSDNTENKTSTESSSSSPSESTTNSENSTQESIQSETIPTNIEQTDVNTTSEIPQMRKVNFITYL